MTAGLAALVVLVFASGGTATQPADLADEFYRGATLARDGHGEEAAAVFAAIVERAPRDPFADDALAELGRLYEERLNDPAKALAAYERLAREYPESRLALRAETRAQALRTALGPGGAGTAALVELNAILYGYDRARRAEAIARLEKLVAAYPEFSGAPRATFWLGGLLAEEGHPAAALARFREVSARWPQTEVAERARAAEADLLLAAGDLDGAERVYRGLVGDARATGLTKVGRERWRVRGEWCAWAILAACAAAALATARRAVLRPPVEVWYLLPVAALFVGAGLTEHGMIGHALEIICAGGLAVTWLSGAALEAARARGPVTWRRALVHASASAASVLAVCYIAVTRERLADMLIETIRFGADR